MSKKNTKTNSVDNLSATFTAQPPSPGPHTSVQEPRSSNQNPRSTKSARWLITGGCGFIGTALINYLLNNNQAQYIRILDNLTVGTKDDLAKVCNFNEVTIPHSSPLTAHPSVLGSKKIDLVIGDIRDPETCEACCADMDIIVHLAANTGVPVSVEYPRLDMESNVVGTFNMLEGARKQNVGRFVFASSGAPAGEVEPPIHEELPPHPVSPYGASKLAGEGYCSAYHKSFGIETVALRFSNVYGPGSSHKSSVVAKFIKQALNGETLVIFGDGTQTRDFIYIDDLVDALYRAATLYSRFATHSPPSTSHSSAFSPQAYSPGGETFQIATSRETTLNEITDLMLKIFGENGIEQPEVVRTEPRPGDVKRNFSDTGKAKNILGWECQWDLAKGLEYTVEWFLNQH